MSLVMDSLSLARDGVVHLDRLSAEFERGRLTTVIGRTLAGKTTLLRAIAGLQAIDGGELQLDGKAFSALPAWRRDVAMVYQQFINYPHLTVFGNVAFPLHKRGVARNEVARRVSAVLETVGLSGFGERKPGQLSGGQQQRVALARALVREAGILLLDEPLVNLDYKLREQLREEFRALLTNQSKTIVIYNTTEPAEAMMLGDRIVVMHEGRILQAGAPADIFDRPSSALVAGIINDPPMNMFTGVAEAAGILLDGGVRLSTAPHLEGLPHGRYRFGIRANEIEMADHGVFSGRATFSEVSGSETFLHIEAPFGDVVLQIEGVHTMPNGVGVPVSIPPERLFVFTPDGDGGLIAAPLAGAR